jgi:hypothetical protein
MYGAVIEVPSAFFFANFAFCLASLYNSKYTWFGFFNCIVSKLFSKSNSEFSISFKSSLIFAKNIFVRR